MLSLVARAARLPTQPVLRESHALFYASMCAAAATLRSTPLPYRGVLVEVTDADVPMFEELLPPSIDSWAESGAKSCMLKLPIEHAGLASIAAEHGFEFHHAEGRTAVLKRWLRPELEDKVPPFATHQVGIAGLIIDKDGRILLVKEWRDTPDGSGRVPSAQWKLPGGLLDRGESFEEAVVREVREETGLNTHCCSILSYWHRHGLTWGTSDLYYVARLELASEDERIVKCPDEISEVTWMPLDEFMATQDHPLIRAVLERVYDLAGETADGAATTRVTSSPDPLVEMVASGVQWPGREPYRTYMARSNS